MKWIDALFHPRSVGVVGSVGAGKIGRVLIEQLLDGGFTHVAAVNPRAEGIRGVQAVTAFSDLEAPIDLAVIASPAATVLDVLDDAGASGVPVAVVITAGFSESGNAADEQALLSVARRHGMRLVGPNCAGIVNTKHNLFPTLETRPPVGDVAFVSQSGALGGAVLSWAEEQGVGLSKFVSYGNAVDLTEADFLEALRDDDETRVVALYIETISDGRRFMRAARALSAVKPLIVIKSGRSVSGGRATQSHTGSMAGADAVYDAALAQCGAIRVAGIEEMFDLCRGWVKLPEVTGTRIAIVTNSGGPGVLTADAAERFGLDIAAPSEALQARLAQRLPSFYSMGNPFDLTVQGTENEYREALVETLTEYDAAIALNVNTPYLDAAPLARGVVAAAQVTGKPIVSSFLAGRPVEAALPILADGGVPNYVTGERCARVLALMAEHAHRQKRTSAVFDSPASRDAGTLPWSQRPLEPEAMAWLETLGFPVVPHVFARTSKEAVTGARTFGGPTAMKIVSPSIVHKTDIGGVILALNSPEAVRDAFAAMQQLVAREAFEGVLVSPMIRDKAEAIVGLSTDPQFGPVIAVGLGGIHTEVLADIALRVAPVSVDEARQMIKGLKGYDILRGARGTLPRDISTLAHWVSQVSQLSFRFPEIRELDLNPVFVLERGCLAGDVRLIPWHEAPDRRSD